MRISFQTFCLFIIVTFVHFAIVAGVTRLGDGPAEFLSAVDSEAILEDWLSPEKEQSPDQGLLVVESSEEVESEVRSSPEFPILARTEVAQAEEKSEEKPGIETRTEPELERTAESEEYSAIVDARLLAGRVESPNPNDYFRNAVARSPKKAENAAQAEPVAEEAVTEEPKAEKRPVPPAKVEKEKPKPAPSTGGPHKIRGIRPIGG